MKHSVFHKHHAFSSNIVNNLEIFNQRYMLKISVNISNVIDNSKISPGEYNQIVISKKYILGT